MNKSNIRVLHVVDGLNYGGVESVLYNYLKNNSGFKMIIASHGEISKRDSTRFNKIGIQSIKVTPKRTNIIKNFLDLRKIVIEFQPDIIHVHMNLSSYLALFVARLYKVPIRIWHAHTIIHQPKATDTIKRILNSYLCNCHIACTKAASDSIFKRKSKKAIILPNAFQINKFTFNKTMRIRTREELSIKNDTILLGNIGRYSSSKNQIFLLNLLKELPLQYELLLIGDGELKDKLFKKAKELNVQNRTHFIKPIDNPTPYYAAMDIFVFPSLHEGLGIALIEAQISGLPCIASNAIPNDAVVTKKCYTLPLNLDTWKQAIIRLPKQSSRTTNPQYFKDFDILSKKDLLRNTYLALKTKEESKRR